MSGALGKSGWAVGARTVRAPYGARYTISHNRMPLDRIPLCMPRVVGDRIDYPLSAIRYPLSAIRFSLTTHYSKRIRRVRSENLRRPGPSFQPCRTLGARHAAATPLGWGRPIAKPRPIRRAA
jgi:hypothetical protein